MRLAGLPKLSLTEGGCGERKNVHPEPSPLHENVQGEPSPLHALEREFGENIKKLLYKHKIFVL